MAAKKAPKPAKKARGKGQPRHVAPKVEGKIAGGKPGPDGLTPRDALFVLHYLRLENATQAAIECKYSPRSAHTLGCRLMKKPAVVAAIAARQAKVYDEAEVDLGQVIREIKRVAFFDKRKLYREDGTLKSIHELDDDTAAGIASIEVVFNGGVKKQIQEAHAAGAAEGVSEAAAPAPEPGVFTAKVKAHPKLPALDMLMRRAGAYEKDNRQRTDPIVKLLQDIADNGNGLPIRP